ncbi:MAG: LysE family translocator [Pseudoruegeria sp.]
MQLGWDFVVFVAALGIAAFTPGPGIAAIVATALAQGARKTLWFCGGVIVGDLFWLTLSLSGLAVIAQSIPIIFTTIKWAGAAYLAWLAWKAWHASVEISQVKLQGTGRSPLTRMLAGFAVTLGNPKAMLFYIALLPNLVQATEFSLLKVLPYNLAVMAVLGSVFAVYLLAAQTARTAMKSPRAVRKFNRGTAVVLGGAATWIASR